MTGEQVPIEQSEIKLSEAERAEKEASLRFDGFMGGVILVGFGWIAFNGGVQAVSSVFEFFGLGPGPSWIGSILAFLAFGAMIIQKFAGGVSIKKQLAGTPTQLAIVSVLAGMILSGLFLLDFASGRDFPWWAQFGFAFGWITPWLVVLMLVIMKEKRVVRDDFKVRSLESIGTINMDIDVGVVRVSGAFLKENTKRNALLRITLVCEDGTKKNSIVRIVRAATGKKALGKHEIALQYDDRIELGIRKAGGTHKLEIEPVHNWLGLPGFLLKHPSPLVRRVTAFAVALMIVGLLFGFIV